MQGPMQWIGEVIEVHWGERASLQQSVLGLSQVTRCVANHPPPTHALVKPFAGHNDLLRDPLPRKQEKQEIPWDSVEALGKVKKHMYLTLPLHLVTSMLQDKVSNTIGGASTNAESLTAGVKQLHFFRKGS